MATERKRRKAMKNDWGLQLCVYAVSVLMLLAGIMELHDYHIQHKSIWWKRIGYAWIAASMVVVGGMWLWNIVG